MEPTYAFTLPSIHDATPLDCRLFHPGADDTRGGSRGRGVKGAIVAHPYAPLGGCYDDATVGAVVEALVARGYVVGTFNFRGAPGSQGKTSWTGRAEQDDYITLIGFMAHYLHALARTPGSEASEGDSTFPQTRARIPSERTTPAPPPPLPTQHPTSVPIPLLLAGYSYGALILARLPSLPSLLPRFTAPTLTLTSPESTTRLRASSLAARTRRALAPRPHASPDTPHGITLGSADEARTPRHRRSTDFARKSVELPRKVRAALHHHRHHHHHHHPAHRPDDASDSAEATPAPDTPRRSVLVDNASTPAVEASVLLISPVLLPGTQTLLPPGPPPLASLAALATSAFTSRAPQMPLLFLTTRCLAIWGSEDGFSASRRLRAWAEGRVKEAERSGGRFEWGEVGGVGHFWREEGGMGELVGRVGMWDRGGEKGDGA